MRQIGATERAPIASSPAPSSQRPVGARCVRARPAHDHQGRGQRRAARQRKRAVHGQVGPQQRPVNVTVLSSQGTSAAPVGATRRHAHPATIAGAAMPSAPANPPASAYATAIGARAGTRPHAQGNDGGAPQQHGWAQQWHVGKEQAKRQPGRRPPAQVGMGQRLQAEQAQASPAAWPPPSRRRCLTPRCATAQRDEGSAGAMKAGASIAAHAGKKGTW